jgi:hypothetical protein
MNIESAYYGANLFYMTVITFAVLVTIMYYTVKRIIKEVFKAIRFILNNRNKKAHN